MNGNRPLTKVRAIVELIAAAMMWGLGFVAIVWALRESTPLAISGWRFVLASLIGGLLTKRLWISTGGWDLIKRAWLPGVLLVAMVVLQTFGLKYTTATKSGFITCLYVLIVPLLEPFVGGARPTAKLYICSFLALVGVGLMCGLFSAEELDEKSRWNFGDFLTLICAFAASAHIFVIESVHKKLGRDFNGFHFNNAQSLGAGLPTLILAIAIEPGAWKLPWQMIDAAIHRSVLPLLGILSLTVFSTLIGFALQIRAQRVLSPSTASLIFLLESPFAALFALMFLGETMGFLQLLGGALILGSVAYSSVAAIGRSHAPVAQ